MKQLSSHLPSGHFRSKLLKSSHSSQMERNKLSSFKKCFLYLQSRLRFHLPSISPLVLKSIVKEHEVDLEITKASLNVLYVCQSGGKITLVPGKSNLIYHENITLVRMPQWGKDECSACMVQSPLLPEALMPYCSITTFLWFCLTFLFF